MKRLLLLLILSPVILFGQMRRGAIVDSINANPTDLPAVSKLISNNQRTNVEQIHAADSGDYVTIVIRVRVNEVIVISALSALPVIITKIRPAIADRVSTINTPLLLPPILDGYPIDTLPTHVITLFKMQAVVVATAHTIYTPLVLPPILDGYPIDTLPTHVVTLFKMEAIRFNKAHTATIPPFPDVHLVLSAPFPFLNAVNLPIADNISGKMNTLPVPVFEEKKMPVDEMHLSDEGYSLLEKLEGFSPSLYALKDGGLTIGFGFFVPYAESRKWSKGVTWEEAELIMREKVPAYEDQVKQYINVPLTQNEFDALTLMAYNLGGFSKATSIVNDINSEADFGKLQKDWMRFVHSKAPGVMKGLMNRRKDEMKVRSASDYQPERKIQILKNIK